MRNLTIKRQKSFVGCLGKMKVYIEDPIVNELEINGVPCRKLGDLKNGEEQTFPIHESAARVYVIADKLSKNYCNEFYPIPAGEEDVLLSGKNQFHPGAGNPFRFDGATDEEVLQNRKKGKRKGNLIFTVSLIVGVLIGLASVFLIEPAILRQPKTFSDEGLKITLTKAFEVEDDVGDFSFGYASEDAVVYVLEEPFSMAAGFRLLALEEYAEILIDVNELDSEVKTEEGLVCFEHATSDEQELRYFSVVLKGNESFWYVRFACLEKNYEKLRPNFVEWAKSIELE